MLRMLIMLIVSFCLGFGSRCQLVFLLFLLLFLFLFLLVPSLSSLCFLSLLFSLLRSPCSPPYLPAPIARARPRRFVSQVNHLLNCFSADGLFAGCRSMLIPCRPRVLPSASTPRTHSSSKGCVWPSGYRRRSLWQGTSYSARPITCPPS